MEYNYKEDTLLHSIGFNLIRLESILTNGILSKRKMEELGINYCTNYTGYNLDDTISCMLFAYINPTVENNAYNKYAINGITLIVEDVDYIYDLGERYINRVDEVLVKDYIPTNNIKGIIIPSEYRDKYIYDLNYLTLDSTSYINIKSSVDMLNKYLNNNKYYLDMDIVNEYLYELAITNNAIYKLKEQKNYKENEDYQDLVSNFHETVYDLDEYLRFEIAKYYTKKYKKIDITLLDIVNSICEDKNIPIYDLPYKKGKSKNDRR